MIFNGETSLDKCGDARFNFSHRQPYHHYASQLHPKLPVILARGVELFCFQI